ncbi:unnamed protein product [Darwinula stevensoni]|uniref:Reticulocalbin-3 n=1 Tax=Darwinula stevensoni TaxID=69355 RepID=A0A7R8ZXS1_9CRUS|nr:unnamed protein product [Darwinula stevensoni]CAG0879967.1 unnamed protein product [Darwinula stevensoni]
MFRTSVMMQVLYGSPLLLLFILMSGGYAVPKSERVIEKTLSDQDHFKAGDHNVDYDHDAFLGHDEAREFEDLSPEESKKRLGDLVEKIDKDQDGYVTKEELTEWIRYTQRRYLDQDVNRQWDEANKEKKETIDFDAFKKFSYGFLDGFPENEIESSDHELYKDMMARDKRRWEVADQDGDGLLNKKEFYDFVHPEETVHMRDIVVKETMEDIDKDKDGKISLEEYIGDMYHGAEGEQEPDWVQAERNQFGDIRDKNKDGFLDFEEVKQWIIPPDYDHAEAEAGHLIYETDEDKDRKLTKEEILEHYDIFVGSQATDFGEYLVRAHDEF